MQPCVSRRVFFEWGRSQPVPAALSWREVLHMEGAGRG